MKTFLQSWKQYLLSNTNNKNNNNVFSTDLVKLSTILFETLRVAFRRLSGGVSLQVVISIISEICLQHIHNFIIVHFISEHKIGEKKLNKNYDK
jgi:hypothetical protein